MSGFKDLKVWKKAHNLTLEIYKITKEFPKNERYRLVDQLCRSTASVPANIAEGKGRKSTKEFSNFLNIARGSIEETKYHLLLSKDLGYLNEEEFNKIWSKAREVGKMLNGLISKLEIN